MALAFVSRPPTRDESEQIRLAMSTYCDGSGMITTGSQTLPGWRDFERLLAAVLGGQATESKAIFDIIVPTEAAGVDIGISVKSKELSRATAIEDLGRSGRVYMELANSPAKFWAALAEEGLDERTYRSRGRADEFGETVLDNVEAWHEEAVRQHSSMFPGRTLDLDRSVYLVISYSKPRTGQQRKYQLHSFDLKFPRGIRWSYRSEKSLVGMDPVHCDEVLVDWYGLSGGQLKYYPRAELSRYRSEPFVLEPIPRMQPVLEKAARYWPELWPKSGKGVLTLSRQEIVAELRALRLLSTDSSVKAALEDAESHLGA